MTFDKALEIGALIGAALLALSKIKFIENLLDSEIKAWMARRPSRQMARRVSEEELKIILTSEREELETLCLLILKEYRADRVAVTEYRCSPDLSYTATCLVEAREPALPSIKNRVQNLRLDPGLWMEIQRIHLSPNRALYVEDARLMEVASFRKWMTESGVHSAYYQTLPTLPGTCGGLLSMSWGTHTILSKEDLAALHFSARTLAAVLRSIWSWNKGGS